MLRICTKCHEEKEIDRFVKQRGRYRSDPYRKDCKDCKNRIRREKNAKLGKTPYRFPKGNSPFNGKKHTLESKEKNRQSHIGKIPGNKGNRKSKERFSLSYKEWSLEVRNRDGKCVKCGNIEKLHAHHIIPWKVNNNLRYNINNGITVCQSCHAKIEGYQNGHKHSEKMKKKMSESKKGCVPWNKGLKNYGTSA